jgi:N2227-like protein
MDQPRYDTSFLTSTLWGSQGFAGPLLWHFENNTTNDPSIELDLEEVKELARRIGFDIQVKRITVQLKAFTDLGLERENCGHNVCR